MAEGTLHKYRHALIAGPPARFAKHAVRLQCWQPPVIYVHAAYVCKFCQLFSGAVGTPEQATVCQSVIIIRFFVVRM